MVTKYVSVPPEPKLLPDPDHNHFRGLLTVGAYSPATEPADARYFNQLRERARRRTPSLQGSENA